MHDGDTGTFTEWLESVGEVQVSWTWYAPEDYEFEGYFDIFVSQGDLDVTYDISKAELKWLESETKTHAGYQPDLKRAKLIINRLANLSY